MKQISRLFKVTKFKYLALLYVLILGCSKSHDSFTQVRTEKSIEKNNEMYNDIISHINKDTYDEIDWLTSEPTGGVIVYKGNIYKDIDDDGIDELFIIREYVNAKDKINFDINYISSLTEFNKYAIRRGFISESYKMENGTIEELKINYEPIATHAFDGGHFGSYYYFLNNGRLVHFTHSYWEQQLYIYDKLKLTATISYEGDMDTGEWGWKINGRKINKSDALKKIVK